MIVGASFDTVEDQKKFADEHSFRYSLISDPTHGIGRSFDAERDDGSLPQRITYLIDPDGIIAKTYDLAGQDLAEHADEVLADIRAASGGS